MFNAEFYPTPLDVIETMLSEEVIKNKTVLEPSAGKGDIVDYLLNHQAKEILAVEQHKDLRAILATKCQLIGSDFMAIESHQISHVDMIVMNPPFSVDDQHIRHAFNIAPPGCRIISLCNYSSYVNERLKNKLELRTLVQQYGNSENLGQVFKKAERDTNNDIGLIKLLKPGGGYEQEFEGFFMFDEEEVQENGIMPYNAVRDLVNRYVEAIKIFDEQLTAAGRMDEILKGHFNSDLAMIINVVNFPTKRNEFKKELQKSGWDFIFRKLDLQKYATKGLKEDINKFVETQANIPFTMKNIYHMLEIVAGTTTQRMDKALLEVFDKLTSHHHENRYNVEGWKTNSHYVVSKKFILPYMCYQDQRYYKGESKIQCDYRGNWDYVEDLLKALCYISGDNYETFGALRQWVSYGYKVITEKEVFFHHRVENYDGSAHKAEELYKAGIGFKIVNHQPVYGDWFDWAYFRVKAFKKGSMHFEFKNMDLWARFNQRIARLKGYPLFEGKAQTAYQDRQAGRAKRA